SRRWLQQKQLGVPAWGPLAGADTCKNANDARMFRPGRVPHPLRSHILGGCARMTASLTAVPQPAPVGRRNSPFSIMYGLVRSFAFHGTSSISNSMMRKLGIAAQKCALMTLASGPLKLCDATLTS